MFILLQAGRSSRYKIYWLILYGLLVFINSACGFEIKPEYENHEHWYEWDIAINSIKHFKKEVDQSCDSEKKVLFFQEGKHYKVTKSEPVHELITRMAEQNICVDANHDNPIKNKSFGIFQYACSYVWIKPKRYETRYSHMAYSNPLMAGAIFNDDPDFLLRNGFSLFELGKALFDASELDKRLSKPGNSLSYRSHNGDLQYLHAMQSNPEESGINSSNSDSLNQSETISEESSFEKSDKTTDKIIDYIASSYVLAKKIDELIWTEDNKKLSEIMRSKINGISSSHAFLMTNNGECSQIIYMFSCDSDGHRTDRYVDSYERKYNSSNNNKFLPAREVALRTLGSALHVIQDSYSNSHAIRDSTDNRILSYYNYTRDKIKSRHCLYDQLALPNKKGIDEAIKKSTDFLHLFIARDNPSFIDCLSRVAADDKKTACWKEEITSWLQKEVINK